jgi:hypothetical protein
MLPAVHSVAEPALRQRKPGFHSLEPACTQGLEKADDGLKPSQTDLGEGVLLREERLLRREQSGEIDRPALKLLFGEVECLP